MRNPEYMFNYSLHWTILDSVIIKMTLK
jgi:hypothetical protein